MSSCTTHSPLAKWGVITLPKRRAGGQWRFPGFRIRSPVFFSLNLIIMGTFSLVCLLVTRLTGSWIYHYFFFFACIQPQGRTFTFPDLTEHRLVIKRLWMWWENFVLQGQLSVPTLILVSVPPLCYEYYLLKWLLFLADLFGMILGFVTDHFLSVLCNQ